MADLEYAAQGFIVHVRVRTVALIFVIPIVYKYRPTGCNPKIDPLRPEIIGVDEIFPVARRIARPGTAGNIHVYPEAVDIVHENRIPVDTPVFIAQVEHRTCVGVSTAGGSRPEVAGVRPLIAEPMHMIGDGFDIVVGIGIEMFTALAVVPCSLDHVEQVGDHTYRGKRVPVIVEIDTPRVARTVREDLKLVSRGVVTPNTGIDGRPFII